MVPQQEIFGIAPKTVGFYTNFFIGSVEFFTSPEVDRILTHVFRCTTLAFGLFDFDHFARFLQFCSTLHPPCDMPSPIVCAFETADWCLLCLCNPLLRPRHVFRSITRS